MNRRRFVASTSSGLAAIGLGRPASAGGRVAPSDRLVGAFIGTGGMGRSNLQDFLRMEDVAVAAVCDVWEKNRELAAEMTASQPGGRARTFHDFRQVLELNEVDFVVVSTPDHWHAIPTILACEAGKDVYVEKPLAHNIYEGRRMVEAARRHGRVVQMGTQQRSGKHFREAVRLIQEGLLGRISSVRCWNFENESPVGIGNPPDSEPPPGLDWDFFLGPAPKVPFNPSRFLGTFRWFWDYSGGKLTDWGTHHFDTIQWAMGVKAPRSAHALGGKFALRDNRETPDTLEAVFEYPEFLLSFSHRAANARDAVRWGYGIEFYGTDGTLFLDRDGFAVYPETRGRFEEPVPRHLEGPSQDLPPWNRPYEVRRFRTRHAEGPGSDQHLSHVRNFLDCVKSREKPRSDVEEGHYSTTVAHLGNISLHTGRRIYWDAEQEAIVGDEEASRLLRREYRPPWVL
jgi:predicted dehydrogenase